MKDFDDALTREAVRGSRVHELYSTNMNRKSIKKVTLHSWREPVKLSRTYRSLSFEIFAGVCLAVCEIKWRGGQGKGNTGERGAGSMI